MFEFLAEDITSDYGFLLRLVNTFTIDTDEYYPVCYKVNDSSNVNEVIRAVLNSFFFLRKNFAHTKSTKSTNKQISDLFPLKCFLCAFFIFVRL